MPDNDPTPNPDADDASKAETIRITLPPKQEQAAVKRETVRINLPGRPVPPGGATPKKETTKLPGGVPAGGPPSPLSPPSAPPAPPSAPGIPSGPKPSVPPPPRPLAPGGAGGLTPAPPSLSKPAPPGGLTPVPKPPTLTPNRPTVPLKPAPAPVAPGAATPGPVKPAAPKKETARITLPPEGAGATKPALPKATSKIGQTQPLVNRPAPSSGPAAPVAPVAAPFPFQEPAADGAVNGLSVAAGVFSLISLGAVWWFVLQNLS